MLTITKLYADIPFAHRQPNHDWHCAWIHGHNWSFKLTFACSSRDDCGFIVDFGKLKFIKRWIEETLDHSLLLNKDDPFLEHLQVSIGGAYNRNGKLHGLARIVVVPDCSCEGLAMWLHAQLNELLQKEMRTAYNARDLRIIHVEVFEDARNAAQSIGQ